MYLVWDGVRLGLGHRVSRGRGLLCVARGGVGIIAYIWVGSPGCAAAAGRALELYASVVRVG